MSWCCAVLLNLPECMKGMGHQDLCLAPYPSQCSALNVAESSSSVAPSLDRRSRNGSGHFSRDRRRRCPALGTGCPSPSQVGA